MPLRSTGGQRSQSACHSALLLNRHECIHLVGDPRQLEADHLQRPACRVGVLLRVMILQHLYGLSDWHGACGVPDPPRSALLLRTRAHVRARAKAYSAGV